MRVKVINGSRVEIAARVESATAAALAARVGAGAIANRWCRSIALLLWVFGSIGASAHAQQFDGGAQLGALFGSAPAGTKSASRVRYAGSYLPSRSIRDQDASVRVLQNELSVSVPIGEEWSFSTTARILELKTSAAIPLRLTGTGRQRVPTAFSELVFGPSFKRELGGRETVGGSLSLGSASDRPFSGWDETVGNMNLFYRVPDGEKNAWIYLLNYSNNRSFANHIPIPGFGYWFETKEGEWKGLVGVPFFMAFGKPTPLTSARFTYFFPWYTNAELGYRVVGPVTVYTGFAFSNQRYYIADRTDRNARLFLEDKRASIGVRSPVSRSVFVDLTTGYAFDRRLFQTTSVLKDRDEVAADAAPFFSASVSGSF